MKSWKYDSSFLSGEKIGVLKEFNISFLFEKKIKFLSQMIVILLTICSVGTHQIQISTFVNAIRNCFCDKIETCSTVKFPKEEKLLFGNEFFGRHSGMGKPEL